jgi:hypothetical protein
MKSPKIVPRVAALVVAALLSPNLNAAAAQRRRRPAPARPRPSSTAPPHVETPPPPRVEPQAAPPRRQENERPVEELLSADSYGVYVEVRKIGTLAQGEEIKTALGALRLFGDETKQVTELFGFVSENAEVLADSRAVVAAMPARRGLPQSMLALELPSVESAVAFEPKFRRLIVEQLQTYKAMTAAPPPAPSRTHVARKPSATPQTEPKAHAEKPEPKADALGIMLKRAGRWLLSADAPFTLRRLRGEESGGTLADSPRFQSARNRFSSEALFVYVDTTLAQQGWALQVQKAQEAQQAAQSAAPAPTGEHPGVLVGRVEDGPPAPASTTTAETQTAVATLSAQSTTAPHPGSTPEETAETPPSTNAIGPVEKENVEPVREEDEAAAAPSGEAAVLQPVKPSEEEVAAWRMNGVLRSLWEGFPRIPGAVALGVGLEGGAVALRLAVENPSDGTISIIPFLPNIISGAPVTADAASVAPADADIFFTASLDWTQIYNATLGTAALNPPPVGTPWDEGGEGDGPESGKRAAGEKPPNAEQSVAAVEKLFGFKFKEDLLPALGNEVALSIPFDLISGSIKANRPKEAAEQKESDAAPGPVAIIALNNPDKVREILPRVLMALNVLSPGAVQGVPEKREGFEIHNAGGLPYTIINNFLVAGEDVKAVRHVIDCYAARQTLTSSNSYRDTTEWQARQKLVQLYVSDALMRNTVEDSKRRSGASTDPAVRALLAQLDVPPRAASYEATNQGDVLLHELRLPLDLVKVYATAMMIGVKDASVVSTEAMAVYMLNRVEYAETTYKNDKKKEHYGTLEELFAEELLEKSFVEHLDYRLELSAAGDKFEATATPKTYGKTGRRSFFIDETGTMRAADHKGQPATAADPPVD